MVPSSRGNRASPALEVGKVEIRAIRNVEKIRFVPLRRLMYVIPEEVTYNVGEMDELSA